MHAFSHTLAGRGLALLLAGLVGTAGCVPTASMQPTNGMPRYQEAALVPVPGGIVNAAGGNLLVERLDLSIDTILGTQEVRARYNALSGEWLWSFQIHYDGTTFTDSTGAAWDVTEVAAEADKFSMGPSVVLVLSNPKFVAASVINAWWSVGGDSDAPDVGIFYSREIRKCLTSAWPV